MVKYPTILNLPQEDINRQLYEMILRVNAGDATAIAALQTAVGDKDSGLVKDVADIKTAIGDESTAASILGRIKALETKTAAL